MTTLVQLDAVREYGTGGTGEPVLPADVRSMRVPQHMADKIAGWYRASGWRCTLQDLSPQED
jgi:hypothetical protein